MVCIRARSEVGARSAQVLAKPARTEKPSVRIVACVPTIFEETVFLISK